MSKFLDVSRQPGSSLINEAIADQVLNAADTYVIGSKLDAASLEARASLRWKLWLTKTAAGVAAPTFNIRLGIAGTIADAVRVALVGPAQTAVVDSALVEILATVRSVGDAAVINAVLRLTHNLDATGFAVVGTPTVIVQSAAFDSDVSRLQAGLSIHPGAAGVWTVKGVLSELVNT